MRVTRLGFATIVFTAVLAVGALLPALGSSDPTPAQQVEDIIAEIKGGNTSRAGEVSQLVSKHGQTLSPVLLAHLQDDSGDVRYWVAGALGNLCDERAILPLADLLADEVRSVSYESIRALDYYPRELLRKRGSEVVQHILAYAKKERYGWGGPLALVLLGDLGDRRVVDDLKAINKEADELEFDRQGLAVATNSPIRQARAIRCRHSALKSLLRLRDTSAEKEVLGLLRGDDLSQKAYAVEDVWFAERKDLARHLVGLLADDRDALEVGPSGGRYYLRVQDLAAYALDALLGLEVVPEENRLVREKRETHTGTDSMPGSRFKLDKKLLEKVQAKARQALQS